MINFNYCWLRADPWLFGWVLLHCVEVLSELGNAETSCDMKAALRKEHVCRRLFCHCP